jgi:hypothetical protein
MRLARVIGDKLRLALARFPGWALRDWRAESMNGGGGGHVIDGENGIDRVNLLEFLEEVQE